VLRAVFVALTLTGFAATSAQYDGSGGKDGGPGTGATGISSEQVRPADF